jgi:hypothetical protein
MPSLSKALTKYMTALDAVEGLLEQLDELGLQLSTRRRFRFYRKLIEPFGWIDLARGEELTDGAIEGLRTNLDRLNSPNVVEGLRMAGLRGKAIGKLQAFETAWDELVEAAFTEE